MKFRFSDSFIIDTSEEPWKSEGIRVGFFANPGAGKSYNAALFIEQWLDQGGTVVVFEPRAEWHTLKQKYQVQVVGGPFNQDVPLVASEPGLYAEAVVEQGISMVFYTGDIEDEEALVKFVYRFINRLLRLQERIHRPLLLVLEETQEYAPRTTSGHIAPPWVYSRMIKALKDCFTQGRKLNVCPVAISQRPQEVNFTIRQLCNLAWFGGFSAQDVGYLDKEVFVHFRRNGVEVSARDLLGVPSGEWLVIVGRQTHGVKVTEKRKTPHGADTPTLEYTAQVDVEIQEAVSDLGERLKEMLEKRAVEESELERSKRRVRELEAKVQDLEGKVKLGLDLRALIQGQNGVDEAEVRRRIVDVEERFRKRLEEREDTIRRLKLEIAELNGLREEHEQIVDQASRYGALEELLRDIIAPLMPQAQVHSISEKAVEAIVDRKIRQLSGRQRKQIKTQGETGIPWVDMWIGKVGTAEQKILSFMADRYPLQMTKSQIALGVGLTAKGGYFTGALNNLVKWKLVVRQGDNYKLAEGPP